MTTNQGGPPMHDEIVDYRRRDHRALAAWEPWRQGTTISGGPVRVWTWDEPRPFAKRQVGFTSDLRERPVESEGQ